MEPAVKYDGSEPVSLDSGEEITIRDLAKLIAAEIQFTGERVWNATQPMASRDLASTR